eukprot:s58_g47.t1
MLDCCAVPTVMPSYKLTYFDIRGLAENARIIFAAAKQPYEDVRLTLAFGTPGDFSTIQRPEFDKMKAEGLLDVSMGKVSRMVRGTAKLLGSRLERLRIGQSKAIERFLASQLGMMGSSPAEAAQVDQLGETVRDIKDAYQKVRGIKDEAEKKTAMEKWFAEDDLKNFVALAEKSLPAGPGPFLVGGKLSLADILFYTLLLAPGGFFDDTEGAKAWTTRDWTRDWKGLRCSACLMYWEGLFNMI